MLKLYHFPASVNSRRVWIILLEKQLPFEQVLLKLDGDQYQPEFLEVNPFHLIPVLVDDGFKVVESVAILDYLEAKYPMPSLMPSDPRAIATVRMVQLITLNQLWSPMIRLACEAMGFVNSDAQKLEQANQQVLTVLNFFESLLGDSPYFGSNQLTLADITTGTMLTMLPSIGVPLDSHPKLSAWAERLIARPSWAMTQLSPEEMEAVISQAKARMTAYLT